jgi:hypothetical protein
MTAVSLSLGIRASALCGRRVGSLHADRPATKCRGQRRQERVLVLLCHFSTRSHSKQIARCISACSSIGKQSDAEPRRDNRVFTAS